MLPASLLNEGINLMLDEALLAGAELVPVLVENGRCGYVPECLTGKFTARPLVTDWSACQFIGDELRVNRGIATAILAALGKGNGWWR